MVRIAARHVPELLVVMGRSLRDSYDVESLLRGEELSSVGAMAAQVAVLEGLDEGRALLRDRPRLSSATVDLDALRSLPAGTLGREWTDHLARNGLDVDALTVPVRAGATDVENWLLERVRQTHDIWHTLLGLGTAPHEEVLVHAFQWPQLHMPYSWLVMAFGTPKHFVLERRWTDLRRRLPAALRAGRRARPLLPVYWERHWSRPIDAVRAELGVDPAAAWV